MDKILTISNELSHWYADNKRDLPFRRTAEPYAIWVSEVMLQQTQVKTMLPYYNRFMEQFPNIASLANASMEDVLKMWEGLGYYRRARYLKKGAETVMQMGGELPKDRKTIEKIPGIGDYTAGAILSICFDQEEPAVDGNVVRVISRVYAIEESGAVLRRECREWVSQLLKRAKPSILNQALMELGATVCVPRNPLCKACPIRDVCQAYEEEKTAILPIKAKRNPVKKVYRAIYIIENKCGQYLVQKRDESGLLPGLWEFPGRDHKRAFDDSEALEGLLELGIREGSIDRVGEAKHVFSHRIWYMTLYYIKIESEGDKGRVWADKKMIRQLPFPSALNASREYALSK